MSPLCNDVGPTLTRITEPLKVPYATRRLKLCPLSMSTVENVEGAHIEPIGWLFGTVTWPGVVSESVGGQQPPRIASIHVADERRVDAVAKQPLHTR